LEAFIENVFERIDEKVFRPERERERERERGSNRSLRKLHNEELRNLFTSHHYTASQPRRLFIVAAVRASNLASPNYPSIYP
jgi:hypothetical protein